MSEERLVCLAEVTIGSYTITAAGADPTEAHKALRIGVRDHLKQYRRKLPRDWAEEFGMNTQCIMLGSSVTR